MAIGQAIRSVLQHGVWHIVSNKYVLAIVLTLNSCGNVFKSNTFLDSYSNQV